MAASALFWDRIARRYAARPVRDRAAYEETLARTRARLAPQDRVLEVGCGTGTTAIALADATGRLTATDISPAMLAIAREKAAAAGCEGLDVVEAAVSDAALPAGPFDAVLAFNLIDLLDDPAAGLRLLADRLRPGGLLISKTVCLGDGWRWMRPAIGALQWLGRAPPVAFLRIEELEGAIAAAGLEILETGTSPARPPARFVVARRIAGA